MESPVALAVLGAAVLHALWNAVLKKSELLSPGEYDIVKAHVLHSVELIRNAHGLPHDLADIVLVHHERYDGSGYPNGLRGDAISIDGAIAALVDSFSALTSSRPYAEQSSPSNALSLMHKLRGKPRTDPPWLLWDFVRYNVLSWGHRL